MITRLATPSQRRPTAVFCQKVLFSTGAKFADHQKASVNSLLDNYIENTDLYTEAFEDNFTQLTEAIKRSKYLDKHEEVSATKLIQANRLCLEKPVKTLGTEVELLNTTFFNRILINLVPGVSLDYSDLIISQILASPSSGVTASHSSNWNFLDYRKRMLQITDLLNYSGGNISKENVALLQQRLENFLEETEPQLEFLERVQAISAFFEFNSIFEIEQSKNPFLGLVTTFKTLYEEKLKEQLHQKFDSKKFRHEEDISTYIEIAKLTRREHEIFVHVKFNQYIAEKIKHHGETLTLSQLEDVSLFPRLKTWWIFLCLEGALLTSRSSTFTSEPRTAVNKPLSTSTMSWWPTWRS